MPKPAKAKGARLDWNDRDAVHAWARDVFEQARDAISAGEDATRAPGRRELGRRAARRIIREAGRKLVHAFRHAGIHVESRRTARAPRA